MALLSCDQIYSSNTPSVHIKLYCGLFASQMCEIETITVKIGTKVQMWDVMFAVRTKVV